MAHKIKVQDGIVSYETTDPAYDVNFTIKGNLNVGNAASPGVIATDVGIDLSVIPGGDLLLSPTGTVKINGFAFPPSPIVSTAGMYLGVSNIVADTFQFRPFILDVGVPDNLTTSQLNIAYPDAVPGQSVAGLTVKYDCVGFGDWRTLSGGGGTVTSVSLTTANGVSAIITNPSTTPDITITLGAITPTSVNGLDVSQGGGSISSNTAVGILSLNNNILGSNNTAVGYAAFSNSADVSGVTSIGAQSNGLVGATAAGSIGYSSQTEMPGEYTFGFSDQFTGSTTVTKTKSSILTYAATTTDATPTEIGNAGIVATLTPSNYLALTSNSAYIFDCDIVARNTITAAETSMWNLKFGIRQDVAPGTTSIVGTPTTILIGQDAGATTWAVSVVADIVNGRPNISVVGETGKTLHWVANIRMTKVS